MREGLPNLRIATEADLPRIRELYEQQASKLGVRMDFPNPLKPPSILALVGEDDKQVTGLLYVEVVPEVGIISTDPRFTAKVLQWNDRLFQFLRNNDFRTARVLVERSVQKELGDQLEKVRFVNVDPYYAHYVAALVQPEAADGTR